MSEKSMKKLIVKIGEGSKQIQLTQEQIIFESMELTETLSDNDRLEFIGCNPSEFKLQVAGVSMQLKDEPIEVSVNVLGQEPVPLFKGYVDSAERTSNKRIKEIIAYDWLYTLASYDVTEWFNNYVFPATIKKFRTDLFTKIGLEAETITLNCDRFETPTFKDFVDQNADGTIYALDLIKNICQMEGKFGIINRYGKFEFRMMSKWEEGGGSVPSKTLFLPFVLMGGDEMVQKNATFYPTYRRVEFSEHDVKNVKAVEVKQSEKDTLRGFYGSSQRKYRAYGNILTRYADAESGLYQLMSESIYRSIENTMYTPFEAVNIGLPYLEVGDAVEYYVYDFEQSEKKHQDIYTLKTFIILKRQLKGIMSMTDTFSAKGDWTGAGFTSDLKNVNKEDKKLEKQVEKNTSDITDIKGSQLKVESVTALPANPDNNTIYLIQGSAG